MDKLYLTAKEAAKYVGIGEKKMHDYLNSSDPPPYLLVGKEKRPQRKALEAYFENLQEVRSGRK